MTSGPVPLCVLAAAGRTAGTRSGPPAEPSADPVRLGAVLRLRQCDGLEAGGCLAGDVVGVAERAAR
ncbi:hypothetical protein GCM10010250_69900 [Streptomyces althioticus]|nr:hypothetical protein GCM10010250_69900 [Streptomyces althioticus]